jgi:serine/threonine protein kinase
MRREIEPSGIKTHSNSAASQRITLPYCKPASMDEQSILDMLKSMTIPARIGPYEFRSALGKGAISLVLLCFNTDTSQYFACKIVPKSLVAAHDILPRFELSVRIQRQLHHPGVICFFDVLHDEHNYYLLMEHCPKGEFFQHIIGRRDLKEVEAKAQLVQIIDGVRYLHSLGIAHLDLMP